jgi:hypothetical protein
MAAARYRGCQSRYWSMRRTLSRTVTNAAPEDAELDDILDTIKNPAAVTLNALTLSAGIHDVPKCGGLGRGALGKFLWRH